MKLKGRKRIAKRVTKAMSSFRGLRPEDARWFIAMIRTKMELGIPLKMMNVYSWDSSLTRACAELANVQKFNFTQESATDGRSKNRADRH